MCAIMPMRPLPLPQSAICLYTRRMRLVGEQVEVSRGERSIFDGIAFDVPAGKALVVTGPNGSGKSTLLKAIAGFLQISAGRIRLEGGDPEKSLGEHCHYLAHANALKPQLSV